MSESQRKEKTPPLEVDWETPCIVCGAVPTMPATEMCGVCTTGESDTERGNW